MSTAPGEEVVIYHSTGRLLLLSLGSLVLVVLGILLVRGAIDFLDLPQGLFTVVGWLAIVLFGVAAVALGYQAVARKPVYVLDAAGIEDRSSAAGYGRIPWEQVAGTSVGTMSRQPAVFVDLRDPDAFLASVSPTKASSFQVTRRLTGHLVSLSAANLTTSAPELQALIDGMRPGDRR